MELVWTLLKEGADVNEVERGGWSPLSEAVRNKDLDCVRILLLWGANPNTEAPGGPGPDRPVILPLVQALSCKDRAMVDILLEVGANLDLHENPPAKDTSRKQYFRHYSLNGLQLAASDRDMEMVQDLLYKGADINLPAASSYGHTALQAAIELGNKDMINLLIKQGAELNSPAGNVGDITALQAAVCAGDLRTIRDFLLMGTRAYEQSAIWGGRTSLQYAVKMGRDDIVDLLIEYGVEVNHPGYPSRDIGAGPALSVAAGDGNIEMVERLLANGADPNTRPCAHGLTALGAAAQGGYLHIADTLLRYGADVNAPAAPAGPAFGTTLGLAATHGRLDMVKHLVNTGADMISGAGRRKFRQVGSPPSHDAVDKFLKYHKLT